MVGYEIPTPYKYCGRVSLFCISWFTIILRKTNIVDIFFGEERLWVGMFYEVQVML